MIVKDNMKRLARLLSVSFLALVSLSCSDKPSLNRSYEELPLGSIRPEGWLKEMLVRQRDGISANLDETYSQVMGARNGWLGGDGDQWERGPYWIDGLLPMAYILDDDALKEKVKPWIEWALASQKEDGSFGPDTDYPHESGLQRSNSRDWWPRMVVLKVLQQHYNATGDRRVIDFMLKYFRYQLEKLPEYPLDYWTDWAYFRVCDNMHVALWVYEKTGEEWILDLVRLMHEQGHDFTDMFLNTDDLATNGSIHCVNLAQGLKEPIVYWQMDSDPIYVEAVKKGLADIKKFNGFPCGMYGGDECLHGNCPTQGSELCSAVELMYSLEEMLKITGDLEFADLLERVTFNALPTQISDDFALHQYFQQANQVQICEGMHNFDVLNGETSLVMGFLSGFPCCLSNLHQGWPKFTQNLWYKTDKGGLAALVYAPCNVTAEISGVQVKITEKTKYPMEGTISFEIDVETPVEFPIEFRIPSWTTFEAVLHVNGKPVGQCEPGAVVEVTGTWSDGDVITLSLPMTLKTDRWYENAVSVERGPLVYALKVEEKWVKKDSRHPRYGKTYWEVYPQSPWNYALYQSDLDMIGEKYEVVVDKDKLESDWYWNLESVPVSIKAKGTRIDDWTLVNGYAGPVPYSKIFRKCTSKVSNHESKGKWEDITLIPYGATTLRISEFPVVTR